ncbi:MAG: T9SS type A sorting domain-containing protein [Flavobacteriales bacterium]|nr:T9SS type A sorting domain-containing protein [Flavobacteriales bacterium]
MSINLKPFLLAVSSLATSFLFSQEILWERSYGGLHADYLMDVVPTADYGFLIAGSSISGKTGNKADVNKGDLDYWVWKMNENGDLDWQKSFGGSGSDLLQSVALNNDGGFVLAGVSSSPIGLDKKEASRGQDDFWVIKLNAKGSQEWQVTIGGDSQEKLHSIKVTNDGGFILGGSSASSKSFEKSEEGFGNLDYWVVKLDNKGKIEWQKTFGGLYADELRSIDTTFDGGYIIGGYSNSPASGNKTSDNLGTGDYWVLKLDNKGNIQWQKTIGGNSDDQLYVVKQTYDKGYILGGNSNSESGEYKTKSNSEGTDFWVVKLDDKGEIKWQETYNYGKYDVLTSIVENKDHSLLIGGFAKGEFSTSKVTGKVKAQKGTDDYIALKIDEKGQELWTQSVGSDGEDILRKVIETRDGGYLFAGTGSPVSSVSARASGSGLNPNSLIGSGNNEAVNSVVSDANNAVKEQTDAVNNKVNDTYNQGAEKIKKALGEDSPLKLGSNPMSSSLGLNPASSDGNGLAGSSTTPKKLPASRDKNTNYGSNDFWVVKLRDKDKPKEVVPTIEAFPNPTTEFTNIIVGYEFKIGTATVVDLAGRQLQQFEITSRTVPVDLSGLPEGIYIINIKTDVQSDGVKVMKTVTKK